MKLVQYKDERGYLYQSFVPENFPISEAEKGIPNNPPDLDRLDWDAIRRELNNLLVNRNLITLRDIDTSGGLSNAILSTILPKLVELYKEQPGYQKSPNQLSSGQANGRLSKEAR